MYPDENADEVWGAARRVQQIADEVHALATATGRASPDGWVSVAADEFRRLLAAECDRVRAAGPALDRAAEALRVHARAVQAAGLDPVRFLSGLLGRPS